MTPSVSKTLCLLTAALMVTCFTSQVHAIKRGVLAGSLFPQVGRASEMNAPPLTYIGCTGFLISPRLFFTSATCMSQNEVFLNGHTAVSFANPNYDPEFPRPYPGSPGSNYQLNGTAHVHPYFWDLLNPSCVFNAGGGGNYVCGGNGPLSTVSAIVVLDEPVTAFNGLPLAPVGHFKDVAQAEDIYTAVSMGVGDVDPLTGVEAPKGDRRIGEMAFKAIKGNQFTSDLLHMSMNSIHGHSAACDGDGGGPYLIGDSTAAQANPVAAALIYGGDPNCNNLDVPMRLDTPSQHCFVQLIADSVTNNDPYDFCIVEWLTGTLPSCRLYDDIAECVENYYN